MLYGAPLSTATAAVFTYRAFQLGVPAVLGTISFFGLRHTLAGLKDPSDGFAAPSSGSTRTDEAVTAGPAGRQVNAGGQSEGPDQPAGRDPT